MKKYIIGALIITAIGVVSYNKVYVPKHTFQTIKAQKTICQ
jgi:hypothetical protein